MTCKAYVKGDNLHVHFNDTSLVYDGLSFQLGDAVTNFSAFPEEASTAIFTAFKEVFVKMFLGDMEYPVAIDTFKAIAGSISETNPYLNYYLDHYCVALLCPLEYRSELPELVRNFLVDRGQSETVRQSMKKVDVLNPNTFSQGLLEIFSSDFVKRQARIKEDFEAITGTTKDFEGLTPMQRVYMLSRQGKNYFGGQFKVTLEPDLLNLPQKNLGKIKSALLENDADIVEMVEISSLDDLLGFELFHTMKQDLILRKCKHCGEFFIVRGRIDTEYCERIKKGETKSCSIIGPTRTYWNSKSGDEIHTQFNKAYKRMHSRQRVGKMTNQEFYEWSEEARAKRDECEAGGITLAEFKTWLGNKKP